jgi:hypothetical protein
MEKVLEELSASTLRTLLIEEVKEFIICLDNSPMEELVQKKARLRKIFDLLTEKERDENAPIVWGKNSTNQPKENPIPDFVQKIISDL